MNAGVSSDHPSIHFYDSDYPSPDGVFPENFDATTEYQGLAFDHERYREIALETGGPILELCCGTGRIAIPLARDGHEVAAVDISTGMLDRFRAVLAAENPDTQKRVRLVEQDVTSLDLPGKRFPLVIIAFNSLLCIPDFEAQCAVLAAVFRHLTAGGLLVLDVVNPLQLKLEGNPLPTPFFTRKDVHTGNRYTRFAMMGALETDQKQRLYGWYDEVDSHGFVKRSEYSLYWRPIFRYEMELMLRQAGFALKAVEGGHRKERFVAESPRMFIQATRPV